MNERTLAETNHEHPASIRSPWVLLLLPAVPALVWWWRRRGQGSLGFSSVGLLAGLPGGRSGWARHGGWLLRFLGLTAIVLARPGRAGLIRSA